MKMNYEQRKRIAIVSMILLIFIGIVASGHRTLSQMEQTVERAFAEGPAGQTGMGIKEQLNEKILDAMSLIDFASEVAQVDESLVENVRAAIKALQNAPTPSAKYDASETLTQAFSALHAALLQRPLSKEDLHHCNSIYDSFCQMEAEIRQNPYNDIAREFNDVLKGFPTQFIAMIVQVEPAELFE